MYIYVCIVDAEERILSLQDFFFVASCFRILLILDVIVLSFFDSLFKLEIFEILKGR